MPPLQLSLLGRFRLQGGEGRDISIAARKAQGLLAMLALSGPGGVARDRLAEVFWDGMPAERARHSLRQLLSRLRRSADLVLASGDRLLLDETRCASDAQAFLAGAASGDAAVLERATQAYAGPLLDGISWITEPFDEWLRAERARMAELAARMLARLTGHYALGANHAAAERTARRSLACNPADEEACRALMHALAAQGRRNAALEQYRVCREVLARQLGVEPEPATRRLYDALAEDANEAGDAQARLAKIAVLPPVNLVRSSELDPLAASLAEDLSAYLARMPGFEVLSQPAVVSAWAESAGDVRRLARTLAARYVITGSLRQTGIGTARLAVQIVDGENAQYLWSSAAEELSWPAAQRELDDLVAGTAARIEQQLILGDARLQRQRAERESAWDKIRRGSSALLTKGWSEEAVEAAVRAYREAIALDPSLAIARAQKALVMALATRWGLLRDGRAEARADAEKAIAMEPTRSEVLGYAGCALADLGEPERALPLLERAVEENPGNAQAWAALGSTHLLRRRFEPGVEALRRGLRISPTDYRRALWLTALASGLIRLERLNEALEAVQGACRSDANFYPARIVLALVQAKSGRAHEAAKALSEAKRLRPRLAMGDVRLWAGRALDPVAAPLGLQDGIRPRH